MRPSRINEEPRSCLKAPSPLVKIFGAPGGSPGPSEGRLAAYPPERLGELEPAYAVTVHKAQGSEYRAVILALSDVPPSLLARGVLYTAITRARELFILVGDGELMARMVANDRQMRRYSALRTRLLRGTGQEVWFG